MAKRRSSRGPKGGPHHGPVRGRRASSDADALVVLAIAWLLSAVDVAGTLLSGRPFGAEATLALLALVAIPIAAWPRPAGRRAA